jgi:hypothetical protein
LGSPESQPANVIFDTGSEFLIVTSVLCNDRTAAKYKFKKLDPFSNTLQQMGSEESEQRCYSMAYDMTKSESSKIMAHASSRVTYGSAKIQGFVWQDFTCINPLAPGLSGKELTHELQDKKCS